MNSYDSFGKPTNASFPTRYQFTGREYDNFSGLQYSRARWYDPKIGGFISEDPIGLGGGDVNLYGYVWNNPQNYTDPSGRFPYNRMGPSPPFQTGAAMADWWDDKLDVAENFWGYDPPIAWTPGFGVSTFWGTLHGLGDPLRVGRGLGCAIYNEDENGYGRAAFVAADIGRAASLFAAMAGPFAGRVGASKGLGTNPFEGKTPPEIDSMFRRKGYTPMGPNPLNGEGTYVNPRNGRGYHVDAYHPPPKPPHVGVHRTRGNRGTMGAREYPL